MFTMKDLGYESDDSVFNIPIYIGKGMEDDDSKLDKDTVTTASKYCSKQGKSEIENIDANENVNGNGNNNNNKSKQKNVRNFLHADIDRTAFFFS